MAGKRGNSTTSGKSATCSHAPSGTPSLPAASSPIATVRGPRPAGSTATIVRRPGLPVATGLGPGTLATGVERTGGRVGGYNAPSVGVAARYTLSK
uniref:Uncharacterized protein n=1 Tax=Caldilinea aerophila TaxID=133453 RepID=A0A7C1FJY0_9CHLR